MSATRAPWAPKCPTRRQYDKYVHEASTTRSSVIAAVAETCVEDHEEALDRSIPSRLHHLTVTRPVDVLALQHPAVTRSGHTRSVVARDRTISAAEGGIPWLPIAGRTTLVPIESEASGRPTTDPECGCSTANVVEGRQRHRGSGVAEGGDGIEIRGRYDDSVLR